KISELDEPQRNTLVQSMARREGYRGSTPFLSASESSRSEAGGTGMTGRLEQDLPTLMESTRRILGPEVAANIFGRQPAAESHVAPFSEVARQLDPMLPQEDYDNIRRGYFFNAVAPRLGSDMNVSAVWEQFK